MYNTMRITGLASGIDTEEMIQQLMQVERIKVDRVEQDKQTSVWRQEAYNSLNKDFANFILNTRKMFGLTSVTWTGNLIPNSYQNLNWVKKATSSDETIATVSSTGKAMDGNYKVKVRQLAEGVSLASGSDIRIKDREGIINEDGKIVDGNDVVKDLKFIINDGKYDFKIELSNEDGITINEVVKKINSAKVTVGEGENAKEVPLGVRASYDAGIGRFFLQTTETGINAKIQITATDSSDGEKFINGLKLTTGEKDENDKLIEYTIDSSITGKNAKIDFNGAIDIGYESNHITINGITMDIIDTGDFTITVATDVDGVYEKIEKFVNDYNELVDKTNKLLGEKRYRDYRPLTVEQKKAMEKGDIELWEEKAKSGLLRNDDIIERTMLNMRRSIYELSDEFSGSYRLITEIGIDTEKYSKGSAGGKLVIDEQKLKSAIAKDPEGIIEFLFKESTPETKDDEGNIIKGKPGGIVTRIYDNIMVGMEEIIKKSGTGENADLYRGVKSNILLDFVTEHSSISLIDKDVLQYNRTIDDLNTMLFRKENYYYSKFTAMEKAISRMNQQSMWLMQQFNG